MAYNLPYGLSESGLDAELDESYYELTEQDILEHYEEVTGREAEQ